jgi:hypothetical protein
MQKVEITLSSVDLLAPPSTTSGTAPAFDLRNLPRDAAFVHPSAAAASGDDDNERRTAR